MLMAIADIGLTEEQRIDLLFGYRDWIAVCPETGAFLSENNGRTKYGDRRYVLILPNKSVEQRGGLFARYEWDHRSFLRAYTRSEAIARGNELLQKLLKKGQREAEGNENKNHEGEVRVH